MPNDHCCAYGVMGRDMRAEIVGSLWRKLSEPNLDNRFSTALDDRVGVFSDPPRSAM
jgi:hypothetical protein